jgi:hypothetical protein
MLKLLKPGCSITTIDSAQGRTFEVSKAVSDNLTLSGFANVGVSSSADNANILVRVGALPLLLFFAAHTFHVYTNDVVKKRTIDDSHETGVSGRCVAIVFTKKERLHVSMIFLFLVNGLFTLKTVGWEATTTTAATSSSGSNATASTASTLAATLIDEDALLNDAEKQFKPTCTAS